jgi:aminoglycoside N3'-acetyltransferase
MTNLGPPGGVAMAETARTAVARRAKRTRVVGNVLKMEALTGLSGTGVLRGRTGPSPSPAAVSRFDALLDEHAADADAVFVHAGLSDVRRAFDCDPYRFLVDRFRAHFESVLVPGFTTSFKRSGVYHKRFSQPEFGTFARLFLEDADYRTDDAIHSILVAGPYRFEECDHHDSFGDNGCWEKLDRDDVLYVNVGTDWLTATQFHYLEQRYDVPYVDVTAHQGVIYHADADYEQVTQLNHTDALLRKFNRPKLERVLERRGVLDVHDLGGLRVRFFRSRALRRALAPEIRRDPYYLIS